MAEAGTDRESGQRGNDIFRIHPAIGVARVGNSEDYVIAPETMAGAPDPNHLQLTGGLPIRPGTEHELVRSSDLRDSTGALKRHAARFKVFRYEDRGEESWPRRDGTEVTIGSRVGEKVVTNIIWTVHVANKKANTFVFVDDGDHQGIESYTGGRLPPIRNPDADGRRGQLTDPKATIDRLSDPARVKKLTIDPGPRTISGKDTAPVGFDGATKATYYDVAQRKIVPLSNYPTSFPAASFPDRDEPADAIDTLGELRTDKDGRLLVLGGYGRAVGWKVNGSAPLNDDVNNNQWFDDTSDGPVSATIVFADGSRVEAAGSWVTVTDPSYAPQILNVVSCWDDVYDCWVRELGLAPQIHDAKKGGYQYSYQPTFDDQIAPIFRSASLQQWTANLNPNGISAHRRLATITADDDPATTELAGLAEIFRNPFQPDQTNTNLMPLHLGENAAFLTLRQTQYFFLQRWNAGRGNFKPGAVRLGPGEYLDKATMVNCLGGRFTPGIDVTFVVREAQIYDPDWPRSGSGPFRIRRKRLDYARQDRPVLSCGYVPRHVEDGLEPGDLSKFMAVPWHTDYNSCATHPPDPNPKGNRKLFWSWPAQRPVAVYFLDDVEERPQLHDPVPRPVLGNQRWSIRGAGTDSDQPEEWGRYQDRRNMLDRWQDIGIVMQTGAIDPAPSWRRSDTQVDTDDWYLEVHSSLQDTGRTLVRPFPNYVSQIDPKQHFNPRALFFQLLNVDQHPEVLADARAYVEYWLKWSEDFSNNLKECPVEQQFFPYNEETFRDRMDTIYQELVDEAGDSDPSDPSPIFRTRDDAVTRIIQFAPFNLIDGAWLRNVAQAGQMDDVRGKLCAIYEDEIGGGDPSKNHCNIYRELCRSVGYDPPPIEAPEFAFDPQFIDSAFEVPAFVLAISQFTADYYPEIIGMTLQLEWEVVELKRTRDLMTRFNIDPHFYVMHIGIDNAAAGHGRWAVEAVQQHLKKSQKVEADWRKLWNGFVAFGNVGTFAEDLKKLITEKPTTLRQRMIEMIGRKRQYGSLNHQNHKIGSVRINEWFNRPEEFLDALEREGWIRPGDWENSRVKHLMEFRPGTMFRVFTDEEKALWAAYAQSLAAARTAPSPPAQPQAAAPAKLFALRLNTPLAKREQHPTGRMYGMGAIH